MPKVSVGRAELDTRTFVLYRFYDRTGVLLYIGITVDFRAREAKHAKYKDWWSQVDPEATVLEHYVGERAARTAERAAIKAEKPLENDQHNEWVEVGEVEGDDQDGGDRDEALALADEALSLVDREDLSGLLDRCRLDWDDNIRSERDQRVEAGSEALGHLWKRGNELAQQILEYLDLLPDSMGSAYLSRARQDFADLNGEDARCHDHSLAAGAMKCLLLQAAYEYLETLPNDEAREWVQSARTIKIEGLHAQIVFGARYARLFKDGGVTFRALCQGPGIHGARCTKRSAVTTHFEICGTCEDPCGCEGHTWWCEPHSSQVEAGALHMLACNPGAGWPVAKSEPLAAMSQDSWAF